jgi:hypothetical protein
MARWRKQRADGRQAREGHRGNFGTMVTGLLIIPYTLVAETSVSSSRETLHST